MTRRKFKLNLSDLLSKNLILISLTLTFVIFLCIGSFTAKSIDTSTAARLSSIITAPHISKLTSFFISFIVCAFYFAIIFFCSSGFAGSIFIYAINAYKAYGIGFITGFIYGHFGNKAFLFVSLGIMPYAVLSAGLLLFYSKFAVEHSLNNRAASKQNTGVLELLYQGVFLLLINIIPVLYETFITSLII